MSKLYYVGEFCGKPILCETKEQATAIRALFEVHLRYSPVKTVQMPTIKEYEYYSFEDIMSHL